MFNKFKSAFYNVVGGMDAADGETIAGMNALSPQGMNLPNRFGNKDIRQKVVRFPYTRPHFLQLNSEDEILVTADHTIRPIICPRDITRLPWTSGYSETINAGKSKKNEDQASVYMGLLTRSVSKKQQRRHSEIATGNPSANGHDSSLSNYNHDSGGTPHNKSSESNYIRSQSLNTQSEGRRQVVVSLPYYYFGVFDGHAGWGAAISASNQLHHILHEKLCEVIDLLLPEMSASLDDSVTGPLWSDKKVSAESAVIGALEQSFWSMDQQICEDRLKHQLTGGCTACIGLFILGKLFVANAGDSRGIISLSNVPHPMSFDFTPESETHRVRKLGATHPELLGDEFTHLEFRHRPMKRDLGKRVIYRDHYMTGWGYKTLTQEDLKYPLVCGEGKRSRVLATIGVTRGFGDHDLRAQFSSLSIKPFLSPEPEVRVFNLDDHELTDNDVLILGTDGLWDITSNEKAVETVDKSLAHFPSVGHLAYADSLKSKYRYTSAAQDLVMGSRGKLIEHAWRTNDSKHATIDDITAFVIPLKPYKDEQHDWEEKYRSLIDAELLPIDTEAIVKESIEVSNIGIESIPESSKKNEEEADIPLTIWEKSSDVSKKNDLTGSIFGLPTSDLNDGFRIVENDTDIAGSLSSVNRGSNDDETAVSDSVDPLGSACGIGDDNQDNNIEVLDDISDSVDIHIEESGNNSMRLDFCEDKFEDASMDDLSSNQEAT